MEISFAGKRAIVTGATKGIGRAIAKQLLQCGAEVIAVCKSVPLLESLKMEHPSITTLAVDLGDWTATKAAFENVDNIDYLVNNAGIVFLEPLTKVTEDHVDETFSVNIKSIINLTQMVTADLIKRNKPGSIVNISSQASMAGLQDHSVYCASKGAVDAFTRAAALELGAHKIRINSVNPTIIMTELGRMCWSDPAKAEPMLKKIPLGRFGEVQEVVDTVLFLLSDKASLITGTCLPVDGGYLAV